MKKKPVIEIPEDAIVALLRLKTPAQRLAIAQGMWRYAHERTIAVIRTLHPDWDSPQVHIELRRRILGSS